MPAWVWVVAAAAVAFVAWFAWGRGWWRSVRYSWQRAAHAEQAGPAAAPWYGSMDLDAELDWRARTGFLPAPPDWREQTATDLSPEALEPLWLPAPPFDPGPGDAVVSPSPFPGPDQRLCGPEQPHEKPAGTESAGSGHIHNGSCGDHRCWNGGPGRNPEPSRLADTGEIRDAHLLAEVAAELRAQDDDARAYCSALERDRQTYMHELREVFA